MTATDQNPKFKPWVLLQNYKWAANQIAKFPTISRQRLVEIMDQIEERYIASSFGRQPTLYFKRRIYTDLGELALAEQYHQEWLNFEGKTPYYDCKACILNNHFKHEVLKRNYEKALELVQPLLNDGKICNDVPIRTYSTIVNAYTALNQLEKAVSYYHKAIQFLGFENPALMEYGDLLIFLGLTENYILGKEILFKQLKYALNYKCEYYRLHFYIGVLVFLKALQIDGITEIRLPTQIELPIENENETFQTNNLILFIDSEIEKIVQAFNQRNQNEYYSTLKSKAIEWLEFKRSIKI